MYGWISVNQHLEVNMSNNKQSSVDWFWNQIPEILPFTVDTITGMTLHRAYQQAKEMHKEEIVNTWSEATSLDYEIGLLDASYILCQIHNAEQYYKETFGGNNEQQ